MSLALKLSVPTTMRSDPTRLEEKAEPFRMIGEIVVMESPHASLLNGRCGFRPIASHVIHEVFKCVPRRTGTRRRHAAGRSRALEICPACRC